jgi:hypothetical protein
LVAKNVIVPARQQLCDGELCVWCWQPVIELPLKILQLSNRFCPSLTCHGLSNQSALAVSSNGMNTEPETIRRALID